MITNTKFSESTKPLLTLISFTSALVSFFADVLQPLAPVSKFICFIGISLGIFLLILSTDFFAKRIIELKKHFRTAGYAIIVFGLMNGLMWGLQINTSSSDRGFFGSNFDFIASIQNDLGVIKDDVRQIKDTTNLIAKTTTNIEAQGTRIEFKLDSMAQTYEFLSKQGGLIQSPSTATEFLYNAKQYQTQGNFLLSRTSFVQFFKFQEMAIDPAIAFADLLIATEGRMGAAETLREIEIESPSLPLQITLAGLDTPDSAVNKLLALLDKNPDYGPIYYQLAKQYSIIRRGEETLSFKQEERKYLKQFLEYHRKGNVIKYFIDQKVAETWIKDAEKRLLETKELENISNNQEVHFQISRHNGGWTVNVGLFENVTKIIYRTNKDSDEFIDTGLLDYVNPQTGMQMVNPFIKLGKKANINELEIFYFDASGQKKGPYSPPEIKFENSASISNNIDPYLVLNIKKLLEQTTTNWLSFRDFNGENLLYYSHLVSYKCAIKTARYGFSKDDLGKSFDMPPCNQDDPFRVDSNYDISLKLDPSVTEVYAQIEYLDGETSRVYKFEK